MTTNNHSIESVRKIYDHVWHWIVKQTYESKWNFVFFFCSLISVDDATLRSNPSYVDIRFQQLMYIELISVLSKQSFTSSRHFILKSIRRLFLFFLHYVSLLRPISIASYITVGSIVNLHLLQFSFLLVRSLVCLQISQWEKNRRE